jgi:hypothetical protein
MEKLCVYIKFSAQDLCILRCKVKLFTLLAKTFVAYDKVKNGCSTSMSLRYTFVFTMS